MFEAYREKIRGLIQAEVYRGDTLENFKKCSTTHGTKVYFDKGREPKYWMSGTLVARSGMSFPLYSALIKAHELDHSPVVLSGFIWRTAPYVRKLSRDSKWLELPEGVALPVSTVWMVKPEINWKDLDCNELFSEQQARDLLQPISAFSLLQQLHSDPLINC